MPRIELDLDNDLMIDPDNSKLTISISTQEGNTLEVKNDGLYAPAPQGNNGSDGFGYEGESTYDYVRIGFESPFTDTKFEKRILCTNVIHRIFDAVINSDNIELMEFREVDCVLVGDFFRVLQSNNKYKYYIVTKTTEPLNGLNNSIISYQELGEW